MNTTTCPLRLARGSAVRPSAASRPDLPAIVAFYTETDADYGVWSRDFNMHFGYYEPGMRLLDREAMLERMNTRVVERLNLGKGPTRVADLGCGTGATARALLRRHPASRISAVTIVPAQVVRGRALNARNGAGDAIEFVLRDYTDTRLPAASYDGVYAVESSCHAEGEDKRALIEEAGRLLKPGGRLVIADCFLKGRPLGRGLNWAYRRWCESWAVPELPRLEAVREALAGAGFTDVEFTDISWKVAPSVAHVPFIAGGFLVTELVKTAGRLSAWRWRHVCASWLSILLGLHRASFGYYLVSARKASS